MSGAGSDGPACPHPLEGWESKGQGPTDTILAKNRNQAHPFCASGGLLIVTSMMTPQERRLADPGAAIEAHRAPLWRYLRVLGADDATADDLVQETFLVALQRRNFDTSDPLATFAFLRTTARHRWLKSRRCLLTRREVEHADDIWDQHCGSGDGSDYVDALRHCVGELPSRSRDLLEATYEDRIGRTEAARTFGMSENGIKSALRRLRSALHDCIERRRSQ